MLPDQSRIVFTVPKTLEELPAFVKALTERLERLPVFEPSYFYDSPSTSTTSASYTGTGAAVETFYKDEYWTNIEVDLRYSGYSTATATVGVWGVRIDGTDDHTVNNLIINTANVHFAGSGIISITGLADGKHTIEPIFAMTSGAGTLTLGGGDYTQMRVLEILPSTSG